MVSPRRSLPSTLEALLRHPRYEVMPVAGVEERVVSLVPREVKIAVTASPSRGLEATLELAERLRRAGFEVVPHLAARLLVDEAHLRDVLRRLAAGGLREVFVIAGDRQEPAGRFGDGLALLTAMASIGHDLAEIGIPGYPESHPFIDDDVTIQAMWDKRRFATYIVSNLCFDARVINRWVARVRRRGVELPIHVGMPGMADLGKLARVSTKIGVGESARFVRRHSSWLLRMLAPGAYDPDLLIAGLLPEIGEPGRRVAGLHVFTFNEIERTERWRRSALLGAAGRPAL